MVTVTGRPPDERERLDEETGRYCGRPPRLSTVAGRFRRHRERHAAEAVKRLVREGRLAKREGKRGGTEYQAMTRTGALRRSLTRRDRMFVNARCKCRRSDLREINMCAMAVFLEQMEAVGTIHQG